MNLLPASCGPPVALSLGASASTVDGTRYSPAALERARQTLQEAQSFDEVKSIRDRSEAIRHYHETAGAALELRNGWAEIALRANRRMGELLREMQKAKGGRPPETGDLQSPVSDSAPTLAELGLKKKQSSRLQMIAAVPKEHFEQCIRDAFENQRELTTASILREGCRIQKKEKLDNITARESEPPQGIYEVIVIDPPWPMKPIELDANPQDVGMPYPTMEVARLEKLTIPCAPDCHVWLWTTHRFLPAALSLLGSWDLKYSCTFVWHKPGGYQPLGLPQYNCEFALYARRGSPLFCDTKNFLTCFTAPRGAHSEKPEEFYDLVRRVTRGHRLDMFNRRPIEGFDGWGKEAAT